MILVSQLSAALPPNFPESKVEKSRCHKLTSKLRKSMHKNMPLNLACLPKQLLEFGIPGVMCRLKHFQASLKVHFQLSFYGSFYKAKRTSIWCLSKSPAYYFDTHRLWFLLQKMPKLHFQVDSTYFPNKVEWRSGPDLSCQCSELGSFLRLFLNDLRTPGPKLAGLSRYPTVDSKLCRPR